MSRKPDKNFQARFDEIQREREKAARKMEKIDRKRQAKSGGDTSR